MEATRMKVGEKLRLAGAVVVGTAALVFGGGRLYSLQTRFENVENFESIVELEKFPRHAGNNIPEQFLDHDLSAGYTRIKKKQEGEAIRVVIDSTVDSGVAPFEMMLPPLEIHQSK